MSGAGCINQHSIGFSTVVDEYDKANNVRTIKEVILYEGSAVLWGANDLTPTLDVKVDKAATTKEYLR